MTSYRHWVVIILLFLHLYVLLTSVCVLHVIATRDKQTQLWRKLYNFVKKCNTDEGSKDWNVTMGKDTTVNINDVRLNCGYVFFMFFNCTTVSLLV